MAVRATPLQPQRTAGGHKRRLAAAGGYGGFSLIELMITVAIVAIISAIAYPSYQQYMIDSRRNDSQNVLLAFATAMQRYRTDNSSFLNAQSSANLPGPPKATVFPSQSPLDSSDKYYNLTLQSADNNSFSVRATPISGKAQDGDGFLQLNSTGIKGWDRDDSGSISAGETSWSD
ncbi:MAG: type IV pilin protein [Motiliproteus sp.]